MATDKSAMLKYLLENNGDLQPTVQQIDQYIRHMQMYEIRNDHAKAFNSPMLGVYKAYFLPKDAQTLFDIFKLNNRLIQEALRKSSSIHDVNRVIRNDFNIGTLWVIHCIHQMKNIPAVKKYDGKMALLKMLNYKFFTGKVNHIFPHGTDEAVMEATIDGLSLKCDIKQPETSTWKAVIESHCTTVLGDESIHTQALEEFQPDYNVGYVLTDLQTRLSSKIINVSSAYYKNHEDKVKIGDSSFTMADKDGEKVLKELKAALDSAIARICSDALNINTFINFEDVKLVCKLVPSIRPDMLKSLLSIFSNMANLQYKKKQTEEVILDKDKQKLYVGYRILIVELIQKTYRHCVMTGTNMNSHLAILSKTRDVYRASRIANPDIISIKNSVDYFVSKNTSYTREATCVSLRTAFILYLIIMSFK